MEINTNLRDKENSEFRENILDGIIKAKDLVNLDSAKMLSTEKKQKLNEEKKEECEKFRSDWDERHIKVYDGLYQCEKCKNWKTRQEEIHSKNECEPSALNITCAVCGNKWKIDL